MLTYSRVKLVKLTASIALWTVDEKNSNNEGFGQSQKKLSTVFFAGGTISTSTFDERFSQSKLSKNARKPGQCVARNWRISLGGCMYKTVLILIWATRQMKYSNSTRNFKFPLLLASCKLSYIAGRTKMTMKTLAEKSVVTQNKVGKWARTRHQCCARVFNERMQLKICVWNVKSANRSVRSENNFSNNCI